MTSAGPSTSFTQTNCQEGASYKFHQGRANDVCEPYSGLYNVQIRDLDKGTFGFVQLAVDLTTGEQVAIKFIERSQEVRPLGLRKSWSTFTSTRDTIPHCLYAEGCTIVSKFCVWARTQGGLIDHPGGTDLSILRLHPAHRCPSMWSVRSSTTRDSYIHTLYSSKRYQVAPIQPVCVTCGPAQTCPQKGVHSRCAGPWALLGQQDMIGSPETLVVQVFLTNNHLAIAMEYAAGGNLYQLVARSGGLPEPDARWYFQQLIFAIDYCHKMVGLCPLCLGWTIVRSSGIPVFLRPCIRSGTQKQEQLQGGGNVGNRPAA